MIEGLPINGLDLTVGIVLLISALLAFIRGFVHEVLSTGCPMRGLSPTRSSRSAGPRTPPRPQSSSWWC